MDKLSQNLTKDAEEAQERLLNAAEELFARKGFDGTSIRDLATEANCNIAAVNYYFGDKKELYEELFRRRLGEMRESRLKSINAVMTGNKKPTLEKLFYTYSVDFLKPFADPQQSQRFIRLFLREIVESRLPKNMFIDELAAPSLSIMEEAITTICPNINKHDAFMCVISLTGQLVHIMQTKMLFEGAEGHSIATINIDESIDHIVKFSAAGIKAYAKGDRK